MHRSFCWICDAVAHLKYLDGKITSIATDEDMLKIAPQRRCYACHDKGQGHKYSFSVGAQGLKNMYTKYEPYL